MKQFAESPSGPTPAALPPPALRSLFVPLSAFPISVSVSASLCLCLSFLSPLPPGCKQPHSSRFHPSSPAAPPRTPLTLPGSLLLPFLSHRPLCPPLISVSLGLPPLPRLRKETEAQVLERQQKAGATGLCPLSLRAGWPCLHLQRWSWRTRFSRDGLQRRPGLQLLACSEPWFAPEKRCSEGTYGPSRGKPVPQRPGVFWGGGRVGD